jgi:hypothetical protein
MSARRALSGAIALGAALAMSIAVAAPANAATLPEGQVISVLDSEGWQYYDASAADASLTPVGDEVADISDYITGVDVDQYGYGYAVADYSEGGSYLYQADANLGTLDNDIEIQFDYGDVQEDTDGCSAIDYTGGVIYAACYLDAENFEATYIGPVDPETGLLTPVIELSGEDYLNILAIAVDPITGQLYGFSTDFGGVFTTELWLLSEDDGASFVTEVERVVFGADFDRDGQLWVTSWVFEGPTEFPDIYPVLATVDTTTGATPFFEKFTVDGTDYEGEIQPITVWGLPAVEAPPVLAATGSTVAPSVAVIAAGVLLFGAVLAAGTAIARRRSVES